MRIPVPTPTIPDVASSITINGGTILVNAGWALSALDDAPRLTVAEYLNMVSLTSLSNKDLLGRYASYDTTGENGEPLTETIHYTSVEVDNDPGDAINGEGLDECSGLLIADGTCGDLTWTIENGTLRISGKGDMDEYGPETPAPWHGIRERITAATVEGGVAAIGSYAFYGMAVEFIRIPDSVTTIGDYAFKGCTALDGVTLPGQLTFRGDAPTIGTGAFKGMRATAYYPAGNATYSSANMLNYGGNITWIAK